MKISCCITALLLFGATVFARIGETEAQIEKRYGRPASSSGSTKLYFYKNFSIIVAFENGVSGIETYDKRNGASMSAVEIWKLLDVNGGGVKWHQSTSSDLEFQYTQKTRFAEYNRVTNTLTIAEQEALNRINARGLY